MPNIYQQSSGALYHNTDLLGVGYAGHGAGLNNPAMQFVEGVGPLPCGWYTIGEPFTHPHCGPFSMRLTPDAANEMFGRAGFLMHGDNADCNHTASDGCIAIDRAIREGVWNSTDHRLLVVPGPPLDQVSPDGGAPIASRAPQAPPVPSGDGAAPSPGREGGGNG